jgi:hypothetical protein
MKPMQTVTLELPIGGNACDYAHAIVQAIIDANCYGDVGGEAALAGLLSAMELPAGHNPETELGPWLSDVAAFR